MSEREMRMQEEALFQRIEAESGIKRSRAEQERIAREKAARKAATRKSLERTIIHLALIGAAFCLTIVAREVGLLNSVQALCGNALIAIIGGMRAGWGLRDVWGMAV